jgi:hypothetical protein
MTKDARAPEPRNEPKTDPHPTRRVLGTVRPERPRPQDEDEGIEIDNAIERPQEGQPGQPGGKPS